MHGRAVFMEEERAVHFYIGEGDLQVSWTYWLAGYCVLMSLVSFIQFGVDKRRARRRQWRIPEKVLFMTAMAGGSPGAILGMAVFHHKTLHTSFRVGLPMILILQICACVGIYCLLQ